MAISSYNNHRCPICRAPIQIDHSRQLAECMNRHVFNERALHDLHSQQAKPQDNFQTFAQDKMAHLDIKLDKISTVLEKLNLLPPE